MSILVSSGTYFQVPIFSICDLNCDKAWGTERPRVWFDDPQKTVYPNDKFQDPEDDPEKDTANWDMDNWEYLADSELGIAPKDNGWTEGGDSKPLEKPSRHNKWCVRNCERCQMVDFKYTPAGKSLVIPDFSERIPNITKDKS